VAAMEKGKGARIPVTKKPYTPTQPSRPTVAKNKQKEHVVPGLEKAMQPPISLSTRKGLCDVTNKSKPRDQLTSSKMGNLINLFELKERCVFIICSTDGPDGNRKNVQNLMDVEITEHLPVMGNTLVEEASTSPNNSLQELLNANDLNNGNTIGCFVVNLEVALENN
jgi:hypothetical protein